MLKPNLGDLCLFMDDDDGPDKGYFMGIEREVEDGVTPYKLFAIPVKDMCSRFEKFAQWVDIKAATKVYNELKDIGEIPYHVRMVWARAGDEGCDTVTEIIAEHVFTLNPITAELIRNRKKLHVSSTSS